MQAFNVMLLRCVLALGDLDQMRLYYIYAMLDRTEKNKLLVNFKDSV